MFQDLWQMAQQNYEMKRLENGVCNKTNSLNKQTLTK